MLTTMPTDASELNEFWMPSFAKTPPKAFAPPRTEEADEEEAEDDWRTFFDTPEPSAGSTTAVSKGQNQRTYRLSTHQSVHSLASNRSQFTLCWMALLPRLSSSADLSARALKFLHRGVMPHLNKPVRLMDWIGGCVDFGKHLIVFCCWSYAEYYFARWCYRLACFECSFRTYPGV